MRVNKLLVTLGLVFTMFFECGVVFAANYNKGLEAYESKDFETALAEWTPLAEQGDSYAQHNLGRMYQSGVGVQQSYTTAFKWMTLSSEQGNERAQKSLGWMYHTGNGVLKSYKTAAKWYLLAAEQGEAMAQNNLGWLYENGDGVQQNFGTALKWYTLAAEQGETLAQINLGAMYENGIGVLENKEVAVKWYTKAADQGDDYAADRLGDLLFIMGRDIFSAGTDGHDCPRAIETFEKAKALGSSVSREYIGFCKAYQRASKGDSEAQYEIAQYLNLGQLVKKNPKAALSWAMKATNNGNNAAGELVGELLIRDLVYGSDIQKLRDLAQAIDTSCSKDPKCAFDKVWDHLDISQNGSISLAELSKFQRDLVQFAYIEEIGEDAEVADAAAINLTSILLLPITSSSILHIFDYNNDGTLQKEEVVGATEFAKLVGLDTQSLLSGIKFEALGNKLNSAMKGLPLPF